MTFLNFVLSIVSVALFLMLILLPEEVFTISVVLILWCLILVSIFIKVSGG